MKDGVVGLKFKYSFDPLEVKGAEAYANDECSLEGKSDEWYEEFFLPYLTEMALDNVGDIVEECAEEYKLEYELISLDLSKENYAYSLFLVAFYKDIEFDIEDYLDEII